MCLLLLVVLTLFPFFVGVLALLLVSFRNDVSLSKEGNSWPNPLSKVLLVHEGPVGIPCSFPDLDTLKNLLSVSFKRGEILWREDICWAVETRKFHDLAHDCCSFETTPQSHFDVLPMVADPLWIKGVWASHRQKLFAWHKFWFALIELDNALLDRLFPCFVHGVIQNSGVNQGHFWRRMGHPLLDHDQAHPIVQQFDSLGMTKRVTFEMKDLALLISNLVFSYPGIQRLINRSCLQSSSVPNSLPVETHL